MLEEMSIATLLDGDNSVSKLGMNDQRNSEERTGVVSGCKVSMFGKLKRKVLLKLHAWISAKVSKDEVWE